MAPTHNPSYDGSLLALATTAGFGGARPAVRALAQPQASIGGKCLKLRRSGRRGGS